MDDRLAPDFVNTRRANRIDWERAITIVDPVRVPCVTINVSAVGILFSTEPTLDLQPGNEIALNIPHVEGRDSLLVHGKVVRVERTRKNLRVAVNLV